MSGSASKAYYTINGSLSNTDPNNPLRTGSYAENYQLTGVSAGQPIRVNLGSEVCPLRHTLLLSKPMMNDSDACDIA
jgi:hypothetical protein